MSDIGQPDICVRDAGPEDVAYAVRCIARAFAADPLMQVFFPGSVAVRDASVARFSELLLRARLAIGAPCLVATGAGRIGGIAMGYAPHHSTWPDDVQTEWDSFVASTRRLGEQFENYDRATSPFGEARPHHYLGVIAIDPDMQGEGMGATLIRAFCGLADGDPASAGVALDTSNPENLSWYARFGFTVLGSGSVGSATVWSLFRPSNR
jgi:ribosomal protein S18 acetylase RimI-like enzyme